MRKISQKMWGVNSLNLANECGQGLAEYAVTLSLIAIVVIAALQALGHGTSDQFSGIRHACGDWTFNDDISVDSPFYYGVNGVFHVEGYPDYIFGGIGAKSFAIASAAGYDSLILTTYYNSNENLGEGYNAGDGFVYLPVAADVPAYGIHYDAGWYFGNDQDIFSLVPIDPPSVTVSGGTDASAFSDWLQTAAH